MAWRVAHHHSGDGLATTGPMMVGDCSMPLVETVLISTHYPILPVQGDNPSGHCHCGGQADAHIQSHSHLDACTPAHLHSCTPAHSHLHACTPAVLHICTPAPTPSPCLHSGLHSHRRPRLRPHTLPHPHLHSHPHPHPDHKHDAIWYVSVQGSLSSWRVVIETSLAVIGLFKTHCFRLRF